MFQKFSAKVLVMAMFVSLIFMYALPLSAQAQAITDENGTVYGYVQDQWGNYYIDSFGNYCLFDQDGNWFAINQYSQLYQVSAADCRVSFSSFGTSSWYGQYQDTRDLCLLTGSIAACMGEMDVHRQTDWFYQNMDNARQAYDRVK